MIPRKALVIVGPTASGKSDLAVKIAKKFNGEVISADSRQVYRGLDAGTGKITMQEMKGVRHHLLDVADPRRQFSAADFAEKATKALTMIYHSKRLPIIVGGTGFYIDALTGAASLPDVPPNRALRKKLSKKSLEELYEMLKESDPRRAKTIDKHNKVRLVRALEIVEAIGSVPELPAKKAPGHFIFIGLLPSNLDERIEKRLKKRISGIIQESKKLIKLKMLSFERMHELGLEYRYTSLFLQGKLGKEEMGKKLFTEIRRYAKRQITWFKRNKKIKWFILNGVEGFKPEEYGKIETYLQKVCSK